MKKNILVLICLSAFFNAFSQDKEEILKNWAKMSETKTILYNDFNDLKFGMVIHFGVYSKLGGMYKGVKIEPPAYGNQSLLGEWIMYCAQIPRSEYREIAKTFDPEGFNAEEWVKLAKDAGMKYIVAMTKHHDGFAMYHSKISDYNIYDISPFKRDPIEEIYHACQKYGIRLGLYYSHSIDWMDGGDAGWAQYKKEHPDKVQPYGANQYDPSPVSYQDYIENKAKPQMREILKMFPNLVEIWYDFPIHMNIQQSFDFYKLAYDLQPKCLIDNRVGNNLGDVLTAGDNEIPSANQSQVKPFETPGTLNDTWGYKSYDKNWKTHNEMLFWIAEIACKGGNYLLNVGPDGNGIIPAESVKILKDIGNWMKLNGEAIYGTRRWTTMKEGPTSVEMKSTTYRKEHGFNAVFTPEDFWFTSREKNVYVISLTTPVSKVVSVKSLFETRQKIKSIKILGEKESLKWDASGDKINIGYPLNRKSDEPGFVLKVEMK